MKVVIDDRYLIEAEQILSVLAVKETGPYSDRVMELDHSVKPNIRLVLSSEIKDATKSEDAVTMLQAERDRVEELGTEKAKCALAKEHSEFLLTHYEAFRRSPFTIEQVKQHVEGKSWMYGVTVESVLKELTS